MYIYICSISTLPCVKQLGSGNLLYTTGSSAPYSLVTQRSEMLGAGVWGDMGIHMADSLYCAEKTNTIL